MKPLIVILSGTAALGAALFFAIPAAQSHRELARVAPAGAVLYLESPDFAKLLNDWNQSQEKADWLASGNYGEFSRSHLFERMKGEWNEFATVAEWQADMPMVKSVAGGHSAVALYDIGKLQFLYVSEVSNARALETALWKSRAHYETRNVAGTPFYVKHDGARTVAFAATNDTLLLATREELLAGALRLLAGEKATTVADEAWYSESTHGSQTPGELRMVWNLEALVRTPHFRTHWIQRNVPSLRQYWAGMSDVRREHDQIREDRVLLRKAAGQAPRSIRALARLAPASAGYFRAWPLASPDEALAAITRPLAVPQPGGASRYEMAPDVESDVTAGSESDMETRIDEPPLTRRDQLATEALREILSHAQVQAALEVSSSRLLADQAFVDAPRAVVIEAAQPWDATAVRAALSTSVANLWSTAGLGLNWVERSRGASKWHELDGLGHVAAAARGNLLFVGNSPELLAEMLDRVNQSLSGQPATYVAEFRHAREQANYEHWMQMLDSSRSSSGGISFFADNVASLGRVLRSVQTVSLEANDSGTAVTQRVLYRYQ